MGRNVVSTLLVNLVSVCLSAMCSTAHKSAFCSYGYHVQNTIGLPHAENRSHWSVRMAIWSRETFRMSSKSKQLCRHYLDRRQLQQTDPRDVQHQFYRVVLTSEGQGHRVIKCALRCQRRFGSICCCLVFLSLG